MTKKISVVIVSLAGGTYLERCLNAVFRQEEAGEPEIIVPCDSRLELVSEWQHRFPQVRFLKLSGKRTFAELRSTGFQNASAGIIALTEDQCIPDPRWCSNVIDAHSLHRAAVGGAVDKQLDPDDSSLNWAVYFCDYSRYSNPISEGAVDHLTDCNVSYDRETLMAISQVWIPEFHETVVHAALQSRGERLWISPRIVVRQQRKMKLLQALRERYSFGRLFGSTRVRNSPAGIRMLYAVGSILLPALLTIRIAKNVSGKKRYQSEFVGCLPLVILLNTLWSFGEFVGYLTARADPSLTPREARL
jgi:hypothetical protein